MNFSTDHQIQSQFLMFICKTHRNQPKMWTKSEQLIMKAISHIMPNSDVKDVFITLDLIFKLTLEFKIIVNLIK